MLHLALSQRAYCLTGSKALRRQQPAAWFSAHHKGEHRTVLPHIQILEAGIYRSVSSFLHDLVRFRYSDEGWMSVGPSGTLHCKPGLLFCQLPMPLRKRLLLLQA